MKPEVLGGLVGIGLLVSAALPAWAGQIAGQETVAQWRQDYSLGLGPAATADWSRGAMSAQTAFGMMCMVAVTVAELEAYMKYRAEPQTAVAEALRTLWRQIGCAVPPQVGQSEPARYSSQARGKAL